MKSATGSTISATTPHGGISSTQMTSSATYRPDDEQYTHGLFEAVFVRRSQLDLGK